MKRHGKTSLIPRGVLTVAKPHNPAFSQRKAPSTRESLRGLSYLLSQSGSNALTARWVALQFRRIGGIQCEAEHLPIHVFLQRG